MGSGRVELALSERTPGRSALRQVVIHGGVKRLLQLTLVVRLKRDDILGAEQPTVKNPIVRVKGEDRLVSLVFRGNAPADAKTALGVE